MMVEERGGTRVSVLGATTVDGAVLTERQRPLVAALALHRDPVAPMDLLVEAVWSHEAPDTDRQSLQNQVTRLRRRFGPTLIETAPGGYRLGVATDAELLDARLEHCLEGRVGHGDVTVPSTVVWVVAGRYGGPLTARQQRGDRILLAVAKNNWKAVRRCATTAGAATSHPSPS